MSEFHFIRPYWLFALLPAFFLMIVMLRARLKQGSWAEVCDAELLPYILQERRTTQNRWPLYVGFFAAILMILSLAGPTWERLPAPVFRDDSALVIVLDLSRSMDAADIKPSRLARARYKVTDILKQRKEGLTALIAYAADAFVVTPLTDDTKTISNQLGALKTEIMPAQGSNSLVAVKVAVELLKQSGLQEGDILLITDGVKGSRIDSVLETAGNYRLSVLGVGTEEGAPIGLPSGGFLKDQQGNIVVPKLDSGQLSSLTDSVGGLYETITIDDDDIDAIMAALKRPKADQATRKNEGFLDQWDEKGPWLLLLVLPFAALFFRKGGLGIVLILLLPFPQKSEALDWESLWQTPAQQGQKAFNRQQYESAAELFQTPERKAAAQYRAENYSQAAETLREVDTASGHYNRGNALAKAGQFEEALDEYKKARKLAPNDEDIQYNSQQVEKALEEQQKKEQKPKEGDSSDDENRDESEQKEQDKSEQGDQKEGAEDNAQEDDGKESEADDAKADNQSPKPAQPKEPEDKENQPQESDSENSKAQAADEDEPVENASQSQAQEEMSESEQANEQWLKRIPDDPSGLLMRKFRYQYGQRRRNQVEQEQAW